MKTGINWDAVKDEMENSEWGPSEYGADDQEERSVYLGTVMDLMPSGKYYTPWANSNVTEKEAEKDAEYWETLDSEASEHGYYIFNGEGDPCDVYIGEVREVGAELERRKSDADDAKVDRAMGN